MSTTLAPGVAPAALVPGDPAGARALAERLERAVGAFAEAASALRSYASTLAEAQERARLALARVEAAEADTAAWRARSAEYATALAAEAGGGPPAGPAPPSHDPGAPGRSAAEALLDAARSDVETAARAAAARLERAAADAPDQPGLWASAWHAAGQFLVGAAEATLELGELVFKLNPTYALTNPQGFVEHVVGLGQGAVYGATHPVEFAKAIVNWDLWLETPPGRWANWSPIWCWPWAPPGVDWRPEGRPGAPPGSTVWAPLPAVVPATSPGTRPAPCGSHLPARVAALRLRAPVALVLVGDRPYGMAEVAATPVAHARAADSDATSSNHTIQQTRARALVRKLSGM